MRAPGVYDLAGSAFGGEVVCEVCIVGSGCGGGTAARLLSEAGHDVVVLEEGGDFSGDRFTQRDAEMYDQLYMDRGGRATEDLSIAVLQGRVLGGGGVINACDVVPIPAAVKAHWGRRFGLTGFSEADIAPHEAAALADLGARLILPEQVNEANGLLKRGTEALGLRGEVMHHNRVGCDGLGTCFLGCPVHAKQNPRRVAIPAAVAAGARVLVRSRAVAIQGAGGETKRVWVRALDAKGYREETAFSVRASVVIVAANAIASAQLLLRSGIGNEHVGRNLMLQPQLPIVAHFEERVDPYLGIPQSYAVTEYEQEDHAEFGLWGFRIEGVMGTPGITSTMLPFSGMRGKEMMAQYAHSAASLLLVPDEPSGSVALLPDGRPVIRYEQRDNHKRRLRKAIREAARIYLTAGATRVMVPTTPALEITGAADLAAIDDIDLRPATAPLISAHQQGTVRFSPNEASGGADPDGQVYGTKGVYVFDSSGFPTSSSSHTMTPIITISRMLTTRLIARM